jgi:hypothetical protein
VRPARRARSFLWRLLDRDGDGALSKADLLDALQLQRARLGWDEDGTARWAQWALDAMAADKNGRVGPASARVALQKSAQLRTILMACEPAGTFDGGAKGEPPSLMEAVSNSVVDALSAVSARAPHVRPTPSKAML